VNSPSKSRSLITTTALVGSAVVCSCFGSIDRAQAAKSYKKSTHTHHKFVTVQSLGLPAMTIKRYGQAWAIAPKDWAMVAGDQGGVDLGGPDRKTYAGSCILPVNRQMQGYYGPTYGTPDMSMAMITAKMLMGAGHSGDFRYTSPPMRFDGFFVQRSFETSDARGQIFYHIYGNVNTEYIESYRLAITGRDVWKKKGPIAIAVALSIHASVALHPSANNYNPYGGGGGETGDEPDPLKDYNKELGTQYYHDPNTGDNYWVDPATAVVNGPAGEGVYKSNGNDVTKLVPGRSDD